MFYYDMFYLLNSSSPASLSPRGYIRTCLHEEKYFFHCRQLQDFDNTNLHLLCFSYFSRGPLILL